jgi:DNA helicase MCM9
VRNKDRAANVHEEMEGEFADFWETHREAGTEMVARNTIIGSICPQVFGLFTVKLAVALTLVGGIDADASEATEGMYVI